MSKCSVPACQFVEFRDSYCSVHYARNTAFGTPAGKRVRDTGSLEDRFHKKYILDDPTGCWLWTGSCQGDGYATIQDGNKNILATRLSYTLHVGPVAPNEKICHTCDIPNCVNPHHLFLGTDQLNATDKMLKGRNAHVGGVSTLTIKDVLTIRQSKDSNAKLAAAFGLTTRSIKNIKTRKTFAHISDTGEVFALKDRRYHFTETSVVLARLSTLTNKALSLMFDVDEGTVSDIRLGRSWVGMRRGVVEWVQRYIIQSPNTLRPFCGHLSDENFERLINSCMNEQKDQANAMPENQYERISSIRDLKPEDIVAIRADQHTKRSTLAEKFGVSVELVNNIQRRLVGRYVHDDGTIDHAKIRSRPLTVIKAFFIKNSTLRNSELAHIFRTSYVAVGRIKNNISWTELTNKASFLDQFSSEEIDMELNMMTDQDMDELFNSLILV